MAIHAVAEGNSIRSIERMTNIHRDTIMRLGVKVGQACQVLLDEKMQNLSLGSVEVDEIWGFIGKRQKKVTRQDDRHEVGDVWTYIALDVQTKLIPSFIVGKRDAYHTNAFKRIGKPRWTSARSVPPETQQTRVPTRSRLGIRIGKLGDRYTFKMRTIRG
jgi:hypothetical protein